MKIKIILTAFIVIFFISFNGCLNYHQKITLKKDGSGEMFIHYWGKIYSKQDSALYNAFSLFDKDSLAKRFGASFCQITNVESYNNPEDSSLHAKIEFTFNSIDSLNYMPYFKEANFSFIEGAPGQKVFSQFVAPAALPWGLGLKAEDYTFKFEYYLPGEIITHNAHQISSNKLVWIYKINEIERGKTLTATIRPFKLKETPIWIYLAAGAVLLVVITYLFKKRK